MSNLEIILNSFSDKVKSEILDAVRSGELEEILDPRPKYELYPHQTVPENGSFVHLLLAGRGAGKTYAVAKWVAERAKENPNTRIAIIGSTYKEASYVLDQIQQQHAGPDHPQYKHSNRTITWTNGSVATLFSSEHPHQIRGQQFHYSAGTEVSRWKGMEEDTVSDIYYEMEVSTRLGNYPRIFLESVPHERRLFDELYARRGCAKNPTVSFTIADSTDSTELSESYIKNLYAEYGKSGLPVGKRQGWWRDTESCGSI